MSSFPQPALPSTRRLVKATVLSVVVAYALLVTIVMPAEFGIDPLGTGRLLGLNALKDTAASAPSPAVEVPRSEGRESNETLAAKAKAAFGAAEGQTLDAAAFSSSEGAINKHTMTLTLEPGKGAEVKSALKAGQGLVFNWTSTGAVAVDMHGERPDVKNAWTSYSVEAAQQRASGTFVASFDGTHGWYWQNRGETPVEVNIEVVGFQTDLYKP